MERIEVMVDGYALLIAIGIALSVWIGGEIGHGVKRAGHILKHAGEKIVHVIRK
jgi:hypothetical protein